MNIIRKFIREYNNFNKGDRHAILILAANALVTFSVAIIIKQVDLFPREEYSSYYKELVKNFGERQNNVVEVKSLFYFDPNTISKEELDSLNLPEFVKRNILNYRQAGGKFKLAEDVRKIYGVNDSLYSEIKDYIRIHQINKVKVDDDEPTQIANYDYFDPNTGSVEELVNSGLSHFQAKNIIGYREKGGVFRKAADLLKIYGIDSSTYSQIQSFVIIEEPQIKANLENLSLIELNSADTTDLLKLNGIGPAYAQRIIKYRNLLGGFSDKTQLLEIYNFPPETFQKIELYIYADTLSLKKIRINFAEYKDFISHPYFSKQQVDAILKYRQKNGSFINIEQLRKESLLDEQTFLKLKPYLTCR
jgi:DNA uptake protein ComE-like DNA-binding protein